MAGGDHQLGVEPLLSPRVMVAHAIGREPPRKAPECDRARIRRAALLVEAALDVRDERPRDPGKISKLLLTHALTLA